MFSLGHNHVKRELVCCVTSERALYIYKVSASYSRVLCCTLHLSTVAQDGQIKHL